MPNGSENFVMVGKYTMPIDVVLLLSELHHAGLHLRPDAGDIVITPGGRLTDEQRQRIRRWKTHLLTILVERIEVVH